MGSVSSSGNSATPVLVVGGLVALGGVAAAICHTPTQNFSRRMDVLQRVWLVGRRLDSLGAVANGSGRAEVAGQLRSIADSWPPPQALQLPFRIANSAFDLRRQQLVWAADKVLRGEVSAAADDVGMVQKFLATGLAAGWETRFQVSTAEHLVARTEFAAVGGREAKSQGKGLFERLRARKLTNAEAYTLAAGTTAAIGGGAVGVLNLVSD